jgi:hypothetical protein
MWPSVSDAPPIVVIGNPDGRRVALLQASLHGLGRPTATVVAWADLLAGRTDLMRYVSDGAVVRIESPGRDWEVEKSLLAWGADEPDAAVIPRLSRSLCSTLEEDRGRLWYPAQWYLGLCAALREMETQLGACPPHRRMNASCDIAVMFDKRLCHARLMTDGVPVAPSLGPVHSYDDLVQRMRQTRCRRVFVKIAHGSSASGVVAYQTDGERHQAATTVEMVEGDGDDDGLRLYNSRRIQTLRDHGQIARLIDALCAHGVHVERWLPKAGFCDQAFDLRVVVIAGQARHVVVRQSRSPMTNLHLLNTRGDADALRARMGGDAWTAAMQTCENAMRSFPDSLYAGLDLLIAPGFRQRAVLEVNAFGDLLPNVLHDGHDTYAAELLAL